MTGFYLETLIYLQAEASRCGLTFVITKARGLDVQEVQMLRSDGTIALTATVNQR